MVPRVKGQYQFDQLALLLKAIKFQYPSQNSVVIVIDPEVIYDDIIRFMDTCREAQFPDIGLSGEVG
jgi:biopolymer transport protein ExbD